MQKKMGMVIVEGKHSPVTIIYDGVTQNGHSLPLVVCPDCGKERRVSRSIESHIRYGHSTGRCVACACLAAPTYRGRTTAKGGYVWLLVSALSEGDQILAEAMACGGGRYVCEHRLVVARKLGRSLERGELVHHLNGLTGDNRLENLKLTNASAHPVENHNTLQSYRDEILRLQAILDEHDVAY